MTLNQVSRKTSQLVFLLIFLLPVLGLNSVYYGSMISSEVFGFELFDPVSFIEVALADQWISAASVVGVITTLAIYFILGGRSFCGWVCPVNAITELFEKKETRIKEKKKNKFPLETKRWVLFSVFAFSFLLAIPVFTILSPIGHTSKAIGFLSLASLIPITGIVLVERIFPRIWCRTLCPVGGFYSLVSKVSPFKLRIEIDNCTVCNKCKRVCSHFELLDPMIQGINTKDITGECIYCLKCVDVCETNALYILNKPKKLGVRK